MTKPVLKIFVAEHCPGCAEARAIASQIQQDYLNLSVEVINIGDAQVIIPDAVFATPTYILNHRIVSLGNPSPDEVARWVKGMTAHPT